MVRAQRALVSLAQDGEAEARDEKGLVARAQAGDEEAFAALIKIHMARVYRIAYRLCWDHDDADDITQDTFVQAFKHLRNFRLGANFAPWLYRIAVNRCLSHRAQRQRARPSQPPIELPVHLCDDPEIHVAASETSSRVREEIRRLPRRQQAAIVLFGLEGWSVAETASIMGCSPGTVKRHLHRAKATLRERLEDLQENAGGEGC